MLSIIIIVPNILFQMDFLQICPTKDQPNSSNKEQPKDGFRRVYTSHNQQIPGQLSYQNIKLANFIQLELTDLWDSLQNINQDNFKNQIKECLSRSYNAFHEMKKLYNDLGMNFLYLQSKKLVSCYGIVFVYLMQEIEKNNKNLHQNKDTQTCAKQQLSNPFQQQVKRSLEKILNGKAQKQTKKYKRNKGIHLFNQSYARCIDYDIQSFRQLKEKMKQNEKTQQQKKISKAEQDRKFKKQVIDQLNDFSHLKVDGEQLYVFLNRHKKFSQTSSKVSLEGELQKIALFFKESQHQALQFLRKQKNLQNFHQLTQGFNSIVSAYEANKEHQLFMVQDKIKQIFQYIKNKIGSLQQIIGQKQQQIRRLKQKQTNKKQRTVDMQCQTTHNFDEQIKQLFRRIVTTQMMNEQLKNLIIKSNQQDRKEKDTLLQQLAIKQSACRQVKDILDQKVNYIVKIERRLKIINQNIKSKNIRDPIQFFNNLSEQMKKQFIQELKQQGFFHSNKSEERHKSVRRSTKQKGSEPSSSSEKKDHITTDQKNEMGIQFRKRQSSFFKKSALNKEYNPFSDSSRKSGHLGFIIQQPEELSSKQQSEQQQRSRQNSQHQKQNVTFKSKKIISLRPAPLENQVEKPRVFDIFDRSQAGFSQRYIQNEGSMKVLLGKNLGTKQMISSGSNNISSNGQKKQKQAVDEKQNPINETNLQRLQRGIIKSSAGKQQKSQNKSIKILDNEQNCQCSQVIENSYQDSTQNIQDSKCRPKSKSKSKSKSKLCENSKQKQRILMKHKSSISRQNSLSKSFNKSKKSIKSIDYEQLYCQSSRSLHTKSKKKIRYTKDQNLSKSRNKSSKSKSHGQSKIKNQKKYHKTRPSCQNQIGIESEYGCTSKSISARKIEQNKVNKWCIRNQFNLTISNTPFVSSHAIHLQQPSRVIANKNDMSMIGMERNNQIKTQKPWLSKNKEEMLTTTRKIVSKNKSQQGQQTYEYKHSEVQNRKTRTMLKKNSNAQNPNSQSMNSTFHRAGANKNDSKHQRYATGHQTMDNFKMGFKEENRKQRELLNQPSFNARHLGKTKTMNSGNELAMRKLIQDQFGEEDVIAASKNSANVQQFRQRVIELHKKKCGHNCKHLQRYLEIFIRLRKLFFTKREYVKMHVENMNQKFGQCLSQGFNLPFIKK